MKQKFFRKVLKNGMTIIFEKRNVPAVSVAFAVKQGGINELEHEKGISHFIEHALYKGTKSRTAKEIAEEIEKKGGELNGFTDEEITAFWCKMPSRHLKIALDVLSDMIKNPLFDEREMEKERKVIFEEMKLHKDNPIYYVFEEIQKNLYKKPFGTPLIGTYESLNSITREKMIKKFKEVYQPQNLILCVVGDADFEYIVKYAEENFGEMQGKRINKNFKIKIEKQTKSNKEERQGIDQANMILAYHVPLANNKRSYAAILLNALMTEGLSSRLFHEIREKRNLAYSVKGGASIRKDFAYNYVYVGAMKENLEKVKDLILKGFEKVSKNLNEKELASVKEQVIGNYEIASEDSKSQMTYLLYYEVLSNAEDFYNFEENIKKVKLNDVKEIARIPLTKHSFFALVPKEK